MLLMLVLILTLLLIIGAPIAVALGVSSLAYLLFNPRLPSMLIIKTMVEGLDSFVLLAIPLFILAGNIMNESGMTRRIYTFARSLVGYLPGGLGHVNIVTSIIFAGMSGSATADAGGIGASQAKAMQEHGFDLEFSAGVTAASSLIGPIIPPSIPMLVYAVIASVSVAELFAAGLIPGLLMGLSLMVYTYKVSIKRKYPRDTSFSFSRVVRTGFKAFWSLLSPMILLGGIFSGIVTPTEGAVIIIIYSIIIGGFLYREITFKKMLSILFNTIEITVSVTMILATSAMFAWILAMEGAPQAVAKLLLSVTKNPSSVALIIMGILLVVGTFMEAGAAMVILVPVFLPITDAVGIDRIHLGIIVVLNLMVGMITPPLGFCLFVLSQSLNTPVRRVIAGSIPFLIPLLILAFLVALIPSFSLLLPSILFR